MNKILTFREIQLEEIKILDETVKYLDKNNIKYSLSAGTLLGAIRHKGFIPWDDDIDILIPRPDYEKLIKIVQKDNCKIGEYVISGSRLGNSFYPIMKVINTNIETENRNLKKKYKLNLWIDIFPLDGMKDDNLHKRIKRVEKIYLLKTSTYTRIIKSKRNIIKKIINVVIKAFLDLIPVRIISNRIDKLARTYSYENSKYVRNYNFANKLKINTQRAELEELIEIKFENKKYKGFKNYDKYLKSLYGDYMKLPPEDQRITHSFKAWRIEDKNEKD